MSMWMLWYEDEVFDGSGLGGFPARRSLRIDGQLAKGTFEGEVRQR